MGEGPGGQGRRGQAGDAERGPEPRTRTHAGDRARAALGLVVGLTLAGCGAKSAAPPAVPGDPHSRPIGRGAEYHPTPGANAVAGLRCTRAAARRFGVHLELFASHFVVIVPPGIGVAPPRVRRGAYVVAGRCSYPARTIEPTGVIQVERGARLTLGDFFAVWGQPLDRNRLLSFDGEVTAFVDGTRRAGDPRAIRLTRHAEIALEVGGHVPPRVGYRFRPGL